MMNNIKNRFGVVNIGSAGLHAQGKIGAKEIQGQIWIPLREGKWTALYYYNNPAEAIPYRGMFYLHPKLPAYLIKHPKGWHVGTFEQIKQMLLDGSQARQNH